MLQGVNQEIAFPALAPRPKLRPGRTFTSIFGKKVLVTGAGGSIGSELVAQIACAQPSMLVMCDNSEYNLYEINCTLAESGFNRRVPLLCDVRDKNSLRKIFETVKPDIVFHAAALKHVPMLENDHNLCEGVLSNVGGTANVGLLCEEIGAEMVLVSTDKAVNPSSVMGLTKRVAEIWAQGVAMVSGTDKFSQVRFGNVMGSSGSVIPMFRRQISQGGPVTVTHPEMTRYMMTIKQAVELVLEASQLQNTKPEGYTLYLLDMGRPIRIIDLAVSLIEQAGLRPGQDVHIEITGVRPGEKIHEELTYPWENPITTPVLGVSSCSPEFNAPAHLSTIMQLLQVAEARDAAAVKAALLKIVPEYTGANVWK